MNALIGIDIGGTAVKAGIVKDGAIVTKIVELLQRRDPQKSVLETVDKVLSKYDGSVSAVGIATAGRVDSERGLVLYSSGNIPGWSGVNLSKIVTERFHLPVYVLNDARAAALAESRARNIKNLVMLTIGTGLGGGIVINGKVVFGNKWEAGEIGHTILYPNGRKCNCGKKGCAESYISMKVLHRYTRLKDRRVLIDRFNNDDLKVVNAVEKIANDLAIVIDRVFLEFDPELVVIGGGFTELGDKALRIVRDKVEFHATRSLYNILQVQFSVLGNDAGIIGASIFAEESINAGDE